MVTDWDLFKTLDLEHLRSKMAVPVLVDLRNIYDEGRLQSLGFAYSNIGKNWSDISANTMDVSEYVEASMRAVGASIL